MTLYQCPTKYPQAITSGCTEYCRLVTDVDGDEDEADLAACTSTNPRVVADDNNDEDCDKDEYYYMCPHQKLAFCVNCPPGMVSKLASDNIGDCHHHHHVEHRRHHHDDDSDSDDDE
jgi:hypothetical protein